MEPLPGTQYDVKGAKRGTWVWWVRVSLKQTASGPSILLASTQTPLFLAFKAVYLSPLCVERTNPTRTPLSLCEVPLEAEQLSDVLRECRGLTALRGSRRSTCPALPLRYGGQARRCKMEAAPAPSAQAQQQQPPPPQWGCCAARGRRLEQALPGPEGRAGGRHGQAGGPGSRRLRRLRWQRDSRGLGGAGAPQPRRRGGRGAVGPLLAGTPAGCVRSRLWQTPRRRGGVGRGGGGGMSPPWLWAPQQPRDRPPVPGQAILRLGLFAG